MSKTSQSEMGQSEMGRKVKAALHDDAERRQIDEDLDATLFVEAAAGTGKTTKLIDRIVAVLSSGRATLDRVVAVTFTERAAGELKLRLRRGIEKARGRRAPAGIDRGGEGADAAAYGRLTAALEALETAEIGTIHGFCASLLRQHPVESRIDPRFEVAADDHAADALLSQAFDGWFLETLEQPGEGVRRVLSRRKWQRGRDRTTPRELLRQAADRLVQHRDFPTPWRRDDAFDRVASIDALIEEITEVAALADKAEAPYKEPAKSLGRLGRWLGDVQLYEKTRGERDYDHLEAGLFELSSSYSYPGKAIWKARGYGKKYGGGLERPDVVALRDQLKARLDAFISDAEADLAACLHGELRAVVQRYEALKQRAGQLDFIDLLLCARDLVRDHRDVREALQQRYSHYFVDEFQDTDPLQAELLLLLAADDPEQTDWRAARPVPGKLFFVGDPKQAIYRFRRADVAIYEAIKRRLSARGAKVVPLSTSFRAVPALQQAVNASFEEVMRKQPESDDQADYVALQPYREAQPDQPAVIALPAPRPYSDWHNIAKFAIDASYPDAVGALVAWLVDPANGWQVTTGTTRDGPDERVALRPHHICVLFRHFKLGPHDVTRPYVRALELRQVAHLLVGGRSFHEREEILALKNALSAIEWPDDELSVYAALRGPLLGIQDDALLAFRQRFGRLQPLRRRYGELDGAAEEERELLAPVADGLRLLGELHARRNRRPVSATLIALLEAVHGQVAVASWPTGAQALANTQRLLDLAREHSAASTSFRAFIELLAAQEARGEGQEATVVDHLRDDQREGDGEPAGPGVEGVRLMTAHKAKGLEFPVVILAEPTANLARQKPSRHVDPDNKLWAEPLAWCVPHDLRDAWDEEIARDRAEGTRLAYVAATRARDLLVVPGVGDALSRRSWLESLDPAIYPAVPDRGKSVAAAGCPHEAFGNDTVLGRSAKATERLGGVVPVAPGEHVPGRGDHRVVWWGPAALELDVVEQATAAQKLFLLDGAPSHRGESGEAQPELDEHEIRAELEQLAADEQTWRAWRERGLVRGGTPTLVPRAVTEISHGEELPGLALSGADAERIEVYDTGLDQGEVAQRPAGTRFGALVHATLAAVNLEADAEGVRQVAELQARMVAAPQAELEATVEAVCRALAHPIMRRAAAAATRGDLRRETPVQLQLEGSALAEGIVDLAFLEDGCWQVVDFKTDRPQGERLGEYERQVGLYVAAIARATTGEARGALLLV